MYVCICKSVTDKQIRRAAARGADNLFALQQDLGVATECGKCAGAAQDLLDKAIATDAGPVLYGPSSA